MGTPSKCVKISILEQQRLEALEKARCEAEKAACAKSVEQPRKEIEFPSVDELTRQILVETNKYRSMHCACRLKIRDKLSKIAQEWADYLAENNLLETRPLPRYGESILCVKHKHLDIPYLMKLWYQEKYDYEYANPRFDLYTGHFTQMVWWDTNELGVGIARDAKRTWIVCNYRPAGNISGHFKENVLPRKLMLSSSESEGDFEKLVRKLRKCNKKTFVTKEKYPKIRCWQYDRKPCKRNPDYQLGLSPSESQSTIISTYQSLYDTMQVIKQRVRARRMRKRRVPIKSEILDRT